MGEEQGVQELWKGLKSAAEGTGPLLQRDYWAVLKGCSYTCSEVASLIRERFPEFPPEGLAAFRRTGDTEGPLEVGDELEVKIRMAGTTAVRVVHADDNSITLATAKDHPEAGMITFGAYRNDRDDVIFHIRSHARSSSSTHYAGFLAAGEPMQTNMWTDFIDCLAHTAAEGVIGAIHAETQEIDPEKEAEGMEPPTFIANGK